MDVEGHEYQILNVDIPDRIETICIELDIIPPYTKKRAVKLLRNLYVQGFEATTFINEMNYGHYPILQLFGLRTAYKLITTGSGKAPWVPYVKSNLNLTDLCELIPVKGVRHLILQR